MTLPRIGIILSTTREGRFADKPAAWLQAIAAERTDLSFELVDLRDYPLPFYDWPASPIRKPIDTPAVLRWRETLAGLDGFIFVTAEYNHSIPAVLKNAIDHVFIEWQRKPAAFVGYGNAGGARAIEQLRLILIELKMAPLQTAVHIGMTELRAMKAGEKDFADYEHLAHSAGLMLDDLLWWTTALKAARTVPELAATAS